MPAVDPLETVVSLHSGRSESYLITLSAREDRWRNFDAECLRDFEVDNNIESGQVLDRKVFGLAPLRILSTKYAARRSCSTKFTPNPRRTPASENPTIPVTGMTSDYFPAQAILLKASAGLPPPGRTGAQVGALSLITTLPLPICPENAVVERTRARAPLQSCSI